MIFNETRLQGAFVIDLEPQEDERGFFARAWCAKEYAARGLSSRIVQANLSCNPRRGTLRGMHYQVPPHQEVKLVRCVRGAIWDVIIDVRPGSPTFLQWIGVELTASNHRMLYVPEGVAHGFQTLADDTEAFYQVTEPHAPGSERGIRWDDAAVGIRWPDAEHRLISAKDRNWPPLALPRTAAQGAEAP
jgi:dTDP-4-dehydrorhamnose 3,5-epimerase